MPGMHYDVMRHARISLKLTRTDRQKPIMDVLMVSLIWIDRSLLSFEHSREPVLPNPMSSQLTLAFLIAFTHGPCASSVKRHPIPPFFLLSMI